MKIRELIELTHKLISTHINVVMDISITSSVVDRVFKPRTSQTIKLVYAVYQQNEGVRVGLIGSA